MTHPLWRWLSNRSRIYRAVRATGSIALHVPEHVASRTAVAPGSWVPSTQIHTVVAPSHPSATRSSIGTSCDTRLSMQGFALWCRVCPAAFHERMVVEAQNLPYFPSDIDLTRIWRGRQQTRIDRTAHHACLSTELRSRDGQGKAV